MGTSPISAIQAPLVGSDGPRFPWGYATVYGAGFSYSFPQVSFDVAYSFFQYDSRRAAVQELQNITRTDTYSSREQHWAASARWRF